MLLFADLWHRAREVLGHPNVHWCEARLSSLIEEPANTWSNLAYILAAWLIFRARNRNHRLKPFAHAVLWMGLFSFIYHASNNALTQWLDFLGMFFYTGYLLTWNAERLGIMKSRHRLVFWAGTLLVNLAFLFGLNFTDVPIQSIVGGNVLLLIVSELVLFRRARLAGESLRYGDYLLALLLMAAAAVCSLLDLRRVWCNPHDHVLQGHATWHLLSAAAIYFTARFYARLDGENI